MKSPCRRKNTKTAKAVVMLLVSLVSGFFLGLRLASHSPAIQVFEMNKQFSKETFFSPWYGDSIPYRLKMPLRVSSNAPAPVFLLLHGSGERGNDNTKQLMHFNLLWKDSAELAAFPGIIIIPQCPEGKRWVEVDWSADRHSLPKDLSPGLGIVNELLSSVIERCNGDPLRVYLIGLSMGGFGVWDLLSRFPERFAAAVPVCGGGDERMADTIMHTPVWVFHGALDEVVKPQRSRAMVEALKTRNADVRYTEYPNVGHGAWHSAFRDPELITWMLSKKRPGR